MKTGAVQPMLGERKSVRRDGAWREVIPTMAGKILLIFILI